jgi:O-glycosyl hydrolase
MRIYLEGGRFDGDTYEGLISDFRSIRIHYYNEEKDVKFTEVYLKNSNSRKKINGVLLEVYTFLKTIEETASGSNR